MKKIITVSCISAVLLSALTACGSEGNVIEMTDTISERVSVLRDEETVSQMIEKQPDEAYIEIGEETQEELTDIIECYHILRDMAGGRFFTYTDYIERDMGAEFGEEYSAFVSYNAFKINNNVFDSYRYSFFRNDEVVDFSSESKTEDFFGLALLYMTDEFAEKVFGGTFFGGDEIMEEYSYVSPAKYWENNDKLYMYAGSDYIYGGENMRDTFRVMGYSEGYIIARVDRYYDITDLTEVYQYIFTDENGQWKLAAIDNISADHSYLFE